MSGYDYPERLHALWKKGVGLCRQERKAVAEWFDAQELAFLASIGLKAQEIFDYAEDFVKYGEPSFTDVALVTEVRRYYFVEKQGGKAPSRVINMATLPPKTEAVQGVEWLPRLIEKAHAKLRGEMPPDLMYGCRGDRDFFKQYNVHPAALLRFVADHEDDREAIINWVLAPAGAESRGKAP